MKVLTCWFTISVFAGVVILGETFVSCGKGNPGRAPLRTNLPIIDSISPSGGPVGTVVTIYGKNLGNSFTQVTVNGKTAGNKTPSDSKFVVTIADSTGKGNLVVKNAYGQTTGPVFNYIFTTSWMVSTFAGNGEASYGEGTAKAAKFNNPRGIAIDASGNLYVADANNNRIRKITSTAVVSTLAGNSPAGFVDGTGTAVRFNMPTAVAVDQQNNVYVTDGANNRIRKVTAGGVVTTFAGSVWLYLWMVPLPSQLLLVLQVFTHIRMVRFI